MNKYFIFFPPKRKASTNEKSSKPEKSLSIEFQDIDPKLQMKFVLFFTEIIKRVISFSVDFSVNQIKSLSKVVTHAADFELFLFLKKSGFESLISPTKDIMDRLVEYLDEMILKIPVNKLKNSDCRQINTLLEGMGDYLENVISKTITLEL